MAPVDKFQGCLQLVAPHLPTQDRKQLIDLIGDLASDLVGILYGVLPGILHGVLYGVMYGVMYGNLPGILYGDLTGRLPTNLFMHRQPDKKRRAVLIAFEHRSRRAVFPHGAQNLWNSRRSTLGQTQLFEKFADAAVAVAPADCPARFLQVISFGLTGRGPG